MQAPLVACVCLTADRQAMTERAVRCFLDQSYKNKMLVIFDTGNVPFVLRTLAERTADRIALVRAERKDGDTIGSLRNAANDLCTGADIIAHWDSDDWSYPFRLDHQVQRLKDAQVTGYHDMAFWREWQEEAWLYQNGDPEFCIGTSLCYWRKVWMQKPFLEINEGEDNRWGRGLNRAGRSSILSVEPLRKYIPLAMIAAQHASNTVKNLILPDGENWTRKPGWDQTVGEIMKLPRMVS